MTEHVDVTVITLTRGRLHLLPRAMASVAAQRTSAVIEHLILIDDCQDTKVWFQDPLRRSDKLLRWRFEPRGPQDVSGPARSAVLRNRGAQMGHGRWIAFLDDDNEFEPDHIETLLDRANATGVRAVHSWLQIFTAVGEPFLEARDPWCFDRDRSHSRYLWALERGVRAAGSNVFRDRLDPDSVPDPVRTVDTSEWLLRCDLLRTLPFPEFYPDLAPDEDLVGEDDAYIGELVAHGEPVACSERSTLRYYLGGYSNTGVFL